MPDLNAGLLQVSDLGNQIQMGRKVAKDDNQNLLNSIGGIYGAYQNGNDQQALNQALAKNFDPTTGQLNQNGVIADMYAYKPQQGQVMAQQYQKQNLANQKTQSDLNKVNAETSKIGSETSKVSTENSGLILKQRLDQNQVLNQLVLGIDPNNPASTQKALQYAKSIGADTSLFDGIDPNNQESVASAKRQASGYLIQANDQIKNQIDQQNANSTTMNSSTQNQVANQDYEVKTNKNNIDMYGKTIEDKKVQNEILTKGMITPQQQVNNNIEISKANNALQKEQITQVNKIQSSINSLTKANTIIDSFSDNALKILKSPLVSGGLDHKTGDILRDPTGKVVPNNDNPLGGIWSGLKTNDLTLNPFNKGSNEDKQLQADYEKITLQARGKGLIDLKASSTDGSTGLGGVSDSEGKMLGVMQNIPDWEIFKKLNPQERVDILDGIVQAGKEDKVTNAALIERGKSQADIFSKQSINVANPTKGNSGQQDNMLYNSSGQSVNLPTSMPNNSAPPLRDQVYKAPNGYVLTPSMYDKILKSQQGPKNGRY
jgi:hypothetical protein